MDGVGGGGSTYPETLAALETARKLQLEKMQIEAAAKQREQQLLQTIRHQQQLLDQLQQAAANTTQVSPTPNHNLINQVLSLLYSNYQLWFSSAFPILFLNCENWN